jgi:hypothetical protein
MEGWWHGLIQDRQVVRWELPPCRKMARFTAMGPITRPGFIMRLIGITERDGFVCLNDGDQLPGQVWGWEAATAGSVLTDDWQKNDRRLLGGPGWPRR